MRRTRVAVLGSTGLVGQQFVRLLDNHPFFEPVLLTSSSRSAGKLFEEAVAWAIGGDIPDFARKTRVWETSVEKVLEEGVQVAFSALPATLAGPVEEELRRLGVFVFSNAGAHRMDEDVPILLPEVNDSHWELVRRQLNRHPAAIVTGSNCSTAGLVLALKPLEVFGLTAVTVTTFQSLSGAGRRGIPAMEIASNVVPFIRGEEEKMERETRKILGRIEKGALVFLPLKVHAHCCRVPVREGHLESVTVSFQKEPTRSEILDAWASFSGPPQHLGLPTAPRSPLIVRTEEDRPQPVLDVWAGAPERARGMAVTVGRLRHCESSFLFFLLVHNTVRGAAGTCVLNAELARTRGSF